MPSPDRDSAQHQAAREAAGRALWQYLFTRAVSAQQAARANVAPAPTAPRQQPSGRRV